MRKLAYLGQLKEYTLCTEVGELFVISTAVDRPLPAGATLSRTLANHGVLVVPPAGA